MALQRWPKFNDVSCVDVHLSTQGNGRVYQYKYSD